MVIFRSSATALPGLIILRLYPRFLEETIGKYPEKIIIVTGTNGKTTTAHLLVHLLRKSGRRVFHNPEGSNMERGIASEVFKKNNLNFDFFVLEADEGSFPKLLSILEPKTVILLNIFRDQLDRYGEINTLMNKWGVALQKYPPKKVIFNADDSNLTFIVLQLQLDDSNHRVKGFSVEFDKNSLLQRNADRVFCPKCNGILKFSENNFYCEQCGFKKMRVEYVLKENNQQLEFNGEPIGLPLLGKYNHYNLAAALTVYSVVKVSHEKPLQQLLSDFHPAFGRFEKIKYQDHYFYVILVKNPAGMDNVLLTLQGGTQPTNLMMCLNDKIADGEDVSWIYDADFENLFYVPQQITFSGTRAYDLALRLKIAAKLPETHIVELDMKTAFEKFLANVVKGKASTVIVTYTCLLELQKIMFKKGMIKKIM